MLRLSQCAPASIWCAWNAKYRDRSREYLIWEEEKLWRAGSVLWLLLVGHDGFNGNTPTPRADKDVPQTSILNC
jgi:hypothetical protein